MVDIEALACSLDECSRRLRHRDRQLAAVISLTRALQSHVELDELIRHAVLTAMATVDADAGSLILHDPEGKKLVFRHVEGPSKAKITGLIIDDFTGIAGQVFHSRRARISLDVNTERDHIKDVDKVSQYQTRTMVTVPLQAGDETIGVIQVLNKRTGAFDDDDLEVLQILASQVASAIVNAQLNERAKAATIVGLMGQISHDIKNLLTPVSMAGQTLRVMLEDFVFRVTGLLSNPTMAPDDLEVTIQEMVRAIKADATEMLDILGESAQIAQWRAREIADSVKGLTAPPVYARADFNEMVHGVCRMLRVVADQHGVRLQEQLGDLPQVWIDARRMYNAIYNLVNNALGATPIGGQVIVRTAYCPDGTFPEGKYFQVQVEDTGQGMPPEIAKILFSGRVRSTKQGGTGLGTLVVRNVIEAHNGKLLVHSVLGEGTCITARIPIRDTMPGDNR